MSSLILSWHSFVPFPHILLSTAPHLPLLPLPTKLQRAVRSRLGFIQADSPVSSASPHRAHLPAQLAVCCQCWMLLQILTSFLKCGAQKSCAVVKESLGLHSQACCEYHRYSLNDAFLKNQMTVRLTDDKGWMLLSVCGDKNYLKRPFYFLGPDTYFYPCYFWRSVFPHNLNEVLHSLSCGYCLFAGRINNFQCFLTWHSKTPQNSLTVQISEGW